MTAQHRVPAPAPRRLSVQSFDQSGFAAACTELMALAAQDFRPTLLVGVRTGGYVVAEAMRSAAGGSLTVLPVTCRRPSTHAKRKLALIIRLLRYVPRHVVDRLRILESRLLARKGISAKPEPKIDDGELAVISAWLAEHGAVRHRLLVVDDAVDSGATLRIVLATLRRLVGDAHEVRAAAITVTTESPVAMPDYALYSLVLCRFPWAADA